MTFRFSSSWGKDLSKHWSRLHLSFSYRTSGRLAFDRTARLREILVPDFAVVSTLRGIQRLVCGSYRESFDS